MQYPYLRRLPAFNYLAPKTLDDALALLAQHKTRAKILAGGTDLLLHMKERKTAPTYVISLKAVGGLDFMRYREKEGLQFGPLITVHALETSPLVREKYPILSQAASVLGSLQVRNLATAVGNLCSALPSADLAPALIVLGASLVIKGPKGERTLAVQDFFTSPGRSALSSEEIVSEVRVPAPPRQNGMIYLKHMLRSAMDLAIVSVAVLVAFEKGACREARICLGTAGPTPFRAVKAEAVLKGKALTDQIIEQAAAAAALECQARSSQRASEEYRREMVKVLLARALTQIGQKAGGRS